MDKLLLFLSFILFSTFGFSCLNHYGTTLDGNYRLLPYGDGRIPNVTFIPNNQEKERLWNLYLRDSSLYTLSDYGVQLIYAKEYKKAIEIYKKIEEKRPGLYTTASNLGTAYELNGEPENAYKWIERSIQINPESHKGSEWIHLKILAHQIDGREKLRTSVLDLNFGVKWKPENKTGMNLEKLTRDIYHQLSERLVFVSDPNPYVGSLFFDLGNCYSLRYSLESALQAYKEAIHFGFESKILATRTTEMILITGNSRIHKWIYTFARSHPLLAFIGVILVFIFGLFILFIFFKRIYRQWKLIRQKT